MSSEADASETARLRARVQELEREVAALRAQLAAQAPKASPQPRHNSQYGSFTLRRGEARLELTNAVKRQVTQWLNKVMQPDPPLQPETLVESLRSGVFLCELALCISDDAARAIPKIHRNAQPGSLFAIENIQSFLHAAVQLGVNPRELFDPACLVSNVPEHRRDERELVYALLSFSLAAHVRYGFPAPDLKGTDPVADSTLAACLRTAIVASGSVNAQRLLTSSPDAKGAGAALLTDIVQAVGLDSTLDPQQKIVLGLDPETTTELAFSEASPSQRAPSRSKRGVPGAVASPAMSEGSVDDRDSTRLSTTSIASAASAPPELQTPPHVIVSRIAAADAVEQAIQAEYGGSEKIEESKDDKSGLKELDTAAVGPGEDEVTEADPGNPVRPLSKQRFSMLELSAEQEFFYLTALAVKMTHNWQEDACLISTSQIWEKAVEQKIPFYKFHSFIEHELAKSLLESETRKRLALAARLNGNEAAQEQPDNLPAQVSGVSGLRDYRAQLLNKIRQRRDRKPNEHYM